MSALAGAFQQQGDAPLGVSLGARGGGRCPESGLRPAWVCLGGRSLTPRTRAPSIGFYGKEERSLAGGSQKL